MKARVACPTTSSRPPSPLDLWLCGLESCWANLSRCLYSLIAGKLASFSHCVGSSCSSLWLNGYLTSFAVDVQPELGVAAPRGKEQEVHDAGMAERPPPQPVEVLPGAPGRPAAPPQGHSQRSVEEPEGAAGRAPAAPPGGADPQPWAAPAEPREGRQGAVPEAEGAGVQERLPVLEPARMPGSPEQHGAGDVPGQSRDVFGGGAHEKKKSGKEAAAAGADTQEADVLGVGAAIGAPQVKSQQASRDRAPGGRSGVAAPQAQVV